MNTPASYPHVKPLPTTGTLPATVRRFTASLGPNAYDDAYPVTWDVLIGGGFRVVDDTTERDGINNDWRKEGMQVYSVSDGKFYTLQSDLLSWTDTSPLLKSGGTVTGAVTLSANGALSAPAVSFTGTPITGGTTTTTKPLVLIETAGATSSAWSTSGTMLGVNAPSGFSGNIIDCQLNGSSRAALSSVGTLTLNGGLIAGSSAEIRIGSDVRLFRDAADTLALRNSTNAQTVRVYNTYTDASNYERGVFDWTSVANELSIGTQKAGTGVNRGIYFLIGGSAAWRISSSGHFLGATDNTYDIGASGATRPRTGYFGTDVIAGGAIQSGTYLAAGSYVQLASGSPLIWNSRSRVTSPNDGVLTLFNAAQSDFSRLQFGGTGATAPALKRSTTGLQVRLADDSDYAAFEADTIRTAKARTVAQLPAAGSAGRRAYVTDANATTFMSVVAGGGANVVPVFDNGTNWVIA